MKFILKFFIVTPVIANWRVDVGNVDLIWPSFAHGFGFGAAGANDNIVVR